MRFPLPALSALLVASASAGTAAANGRFPNAQQLRELAPGTLVVAGTYGLLVTTNGGRDFGYVCESEMFGKSAGSFTLDPLLERAPDGSFVTGSLQGARVARQRGCAFETIATLPRNYAFFGEEPPPDGAAGLVVDLCRRGTHDEAPLLALVSLTDAAGFPLEHRLYEARQGVDFTPLGTAIPASLLEFALTLDAAPSNPERFYVSGRSGDRALLVTSSDAGESWQAFPIDAAGSEGSLGVYLGGVSPSDEQRVYARVSRTRLTDNGYYLWDDSLLVSDDAGASFVEVLRRDAALLGFALSPDGETLLAGFGDPRRDAALSARSELGIDAASTSAAASELAFERIVSELDVNCLHWTESGLYACATEMDPLGVEPSIDADFHLGVYRGGGLPERRSDFTPLLALRDVRGPLPWADGSESPCAAEWLSGDPATPGSFGACRVLNACDAGAELSEGALVCGASGAGEGGAAGAFGDAGAASGRRAEAAGDGGCGCRSVRRASGAGGLLAFAFCLGWWHRFRKRCRRSSF